MKKEPIPEEFRGLPGTESIPELWPGALYGSVGLAAIPPAEREELGFRFPEEFPQDQIM